MNWSNRLLNVNDETKILKRSALWNCAAGALSSSFVSLLMMVITRAGEVELAGDFSIASVIAYQCLTIGSFATYNVQVSDSEKEFKFNDFLGIRVISSILMMLMMGHYAFASGYTPEKAWIVFAFCLFKSSDIVDDLFRAEYHRVHRLDIASVVLIVRYAVALVVFTVLFLLTHDLIITSMISAVVLMAVTLWLHRSLIYRFVDEAIRPRFIKMKSLLWLLLPLCVSNYIRMYIVNLPKYTIDAVLASEFQTYFGILIMPAMIINLLAELLFAPFIPRLAEHWSKDIVSFYKLVLRQIVAVLAVTLIMIAGGWTVGLKLLEIVYAVNLSDYMVCLILILIGGGLNAASIFMSLVLTVQRRQKWTVLVYFAILACSFFFAKQMVIKYELLGASILYCFICAMNFIIFLMISFLKKNLKEQVIE